MNFQDLLNEVEDAMQSPRSGGGQAAGVKYSNDVESSSRLAHPVSKSRVRLALVMHDHAQFTHTIMTWKGKNELDDLLDMLGDDDSKPAAVHPRPTQSTGAGAYNSSDTKPSRTEFQAGGTKK